MRVNLFEFNDQPWLPEVLRNALLSYLFVAYRATPFGGIFARQVAALLKLTGSNKIVDLCSGAGGPVSLVDAELKRAGAVVQITMTDLYPNPSVRGAIPYWPEPVDARAVPAELKGTRTMFAAFHHFQPPDARQILRNAFEQRGAIGVFEVTARTPAGILLAVLIPFGVLLMTPRIRPVTAFQILFTYVIPLLPLMIFWDGFVSQLRTYTAAEMLAMTVDLKAPDYVWEAGSMQVAGTPLSVPYLIGRPI